MSSVDFTTSDLCDANEATIRVVEPGFVAYGGRVKLAGRITTVKCHEDNQLVKDVLGEDGRGKVLVVDGGGSLRRALLGDQIAANAVKNGWSGVIVFGCIRDSAEIAKLDLAVRALATNPHKTVKRGWGERDVPVHFHGVSFVPGDHVYADEDGIVVNATPLV